MYSSRYVCIPLCACVHLLMWGYMCACVLCVRVHYVRASDYDYVTCIECANSQVIFKLRP
ncbi:hypothetical protein phiK7A1_176 [Pseudomonas phage phiK7A1]|uniref:Uncharacterized protein n=1 Tax=Pseudomonas phage phiK7A1 TaxID=2759194 RepID=A0A7H0XG24_9CAUD|nr:hypothetical protein phiK7A1_176 [Pseudomonas phage phiK7A1]